MDNFEKPRWLRDLIRFVPLKSQFVLSGNIRDWQLYDHGQGQIGWFSLREQLTLELKSLGYAHVVSYNPVTGFDIPFFSGSQDEKLELLEKIAGVDNLNLASSCPETRSSREREKNIRCVLLHMGV